MMNLEANIFPVFELKPEDVPNIRKYLADIPQMERFFVETPLDLVVLENYQFVITRRFKLYGEWHVGGANGEILNVYTLVTGLKTFFEGELALREGRDEQ
jgi:hypothetical protein